jgi:putative lipoic acid-binding regulatory protein
MSKPNGHAEESIIQFPCDFTIKVMGKTNSDFEKIVIATVQEHFPETSAAGIQKKLSKDNNYLSLSITVYAESKPQLDSLYKALSSNPLVLMVL